MSVALDVAGPDGRDLVINVDAEQGIMALTLGLSQIFDSTAVDRLWVMHEGDYVPLAVDDFPTDTPLRVLLAEGVMHRVILSEERPAIRGGP